MRESETQMLVTIFGGEVLLSRSLGIEDYPSETQESILEHFCELVFKRVLLDVPSSQINQVLDAFESHRASGRALINLIDELRRFVPGMDQFIADELSRSATEFRVSQFTE